ncbi:hypothetical protein APR41_15225 [Salegentibacter salinarum]|uniref:Uncharacterized protein n=1 Tax=Salegentibacter salinarum TaxID=447422 RepID=A0A2N0TZ57_9FLAO|nr:hypothetical protein APR41_15225 [Salegentibacter salinarum]
MVILYLYYYTFLSLIFNFLEMLNISNTLVLYVAEKEWVVFRIVFCSTYVISLLAVFYDLFIDFREN